MLAFGQRLRQLGLHRGVGVPAAAGRLRNVYPAELLVLPVVAQADGERCAGGARRHGGLAVVRSSLGHVDGVVHPLVGSGIANGIAAIAGDDVDALVVSAVVGTALVFSVGVVEREALASPVEILKLDGAGQAHLGKRRADAIDLQRGLGYLRLASLHIGGNGRDVVGALHSGCELGGVRLFGECGYQHVVGKHPDVFNGGRADHGRGGDGGRLAHIDGRRADAHRGPDGVVGLQAGKGHLADAEAAIVYAEAQGAPACLKGCVESEVDGAVGSIAARAGHRHEIAQENHVAEVVVDKMEQAGVLC